MTVQRLRTLLADRRGISAVEFAILAPVMILLTTATIEAAHLMMVRMTLEGAVGEAARTSMVSLHISEEDRDVSMRAMIGRRMASFQAHEGKSLSIATTVYRDFGSSHPEGYQDLNGNGRYDPPGGSAPGEPFDDRNRNGTRDVAAPVEGKLGGPGDVVSYTASYPAALYFGFLTPLFGAEEGFLVTASAVLRNEPVRRNRLET